MKYKLEKVETGLLAEQSGAFYQDTDENVKAYEHAFTVTVKDYLGMDEVFYFKTKEAADAFIKELED